MDIHGYLETVRLLPRSKGEDEQSVSKQAQDSRRVSMALVLLALGFMYSVHNLIAPNMTAIAKLFHFNKFERDAYLGGELTLFFYFPGVFGALLAGILSGFLDRQWLLAGLAVMTSLACLFTARCTTFGELAWWRALTGFSIGGSLPVVYSLIGDWFPAKKRASATAFVTAASGAGVFLGQCVATIAGSVDWRWPFLVIAVPAAATGVMIWFIAEEPLRGCQEGGIETRSLYSNPVQQVPLFSARQRRALLQNRTNLIVILQAFPGNIPWGVIIVYIHDFLVQDLGLTTQSALGSIATLAGAAFLGVLTGGFIGEQLYGASSRYLGIFGGICNIARALPFFILFGWKDMFGPLAHTSELAFFLLLMIGGFTATMASACTGAMLLNVNLPEMRGSVMALYSVLDDLSKGFGTLFVSMIVPLVGGRAVAYQISLFLWIFTGVALLYTWYTFDEDELQMKKNLDEAAQESMVLLSKQRAQQEIHHRAKAAGAAHFATRGSAPAARSAKPPQTQPWLSSWSGQAAAEAAVASNAGTKSSSSSGNAPRPRTGDPGAPTVADLKAEQRERLRKAARAAAEAMAAARGH